MSVTLYAVQFDCIRLMWSDPGTSHGYTCLFKATSMYRLLHVTVTPADVKSLGPKMIKDVVNCIEGSQKSRVCTTIGKPPNMEDVCICLIGCIYMDAKYGRRLHLSDWPHLYGYDVDVARKFIYYKFSIGSPRR